MHFCLSAARPEGARKDREERSLATNTRHRWRHRNDFHQRKAYDTIFHPPRLQHWPDRVEFNSMSPQFSQSPKLPHVSSSLYFSLTPFDTPAYIHVILPHFPFPFTQGTRVLEPMEEYHHPHRQCDIHSNRTPSLVGLRPPGARFLSCRHPLLSNL